MSDLISREAAPLPCPLCSADMGIEGEGWEHPPSDDCPLDSLFILPRHVTAWNRRAMPAAPAVKVLVWEHGHKFCGQECSYADTEFGAWMMVAYSGRGLRWAHIDPAGNDSEDDWETRDECQAAANADYEARILAALEGLNDG